MTLYLNFICFCSYQILQKHRMWLLLMPKPKILINTRIFKSLHRYLSIADFGRCKLKYSYLQHSEPTVFSQFYTYNTVPVFLNFLHMKTLFIASWLTIKFIKHIYYIRYLSIIFSWNLSKQNIWFWCHYYSKGSILVFYE